MTDFVVTMRDWRRMCKMYTVDEHECEGCPLEHITEHACGAIFEPEFADVIDWATLEKIVDEWAAGHPVKVYPTWVEWLGEMGVILKPYGWDFCFPGTSHKLVCTTSKKAEDPIPEEIAKKLGLELKEGQDR